MILNIFHINKWCFCKKATAIALELNKGRMKM